jgi:hypothetical protein
MTTVVLSAVAIGFLVLYLIRRQARLRSEENDF